MTNEVAGKAVAWWCHGLMEKQPDSSHDLFVSEADAKAYADKQRDMRIRKVTPLYLAPPPPDTSQAAEIERLRKALEPFAAAAEWVAEHHPGWDHDAFNIGGSLGDAIAFADFRRARSALTESARP